MPSRFYLPNLPGAGPCELVGSEFHHLAHVVRIRPGDEVQLFDGEGNRARAQLIALGKSAATLTVLERGGTAETGSGRLVLATAVPKADRFRWLVEKATELGVDALIPLHTQHSVVEPGAMKLERMRLAVIEACKQSGRDRLMEISPDCRWGEFLTLVKPQQTLLIADPSGVPPSQVLRDRSGPIVLAVGPEGGFTRDEMQQALDTGAQLVSLGAVLLRIETAALAMAVLFGKGNWRSGQR